MLILELAVQAVRGFSPAARIALKAGYTGLNSPTEVPAPLSGLIASLVYPDGRGGDAAYLAPGQKTGKAGLSLQGNDQTVYRIVRELGGSGALHRFNKDANKFEVVTQDATEMASTLRSTAGLPPRASFEQLFTFTAAHLPTRRPRQRRGSDAETVRGVSGVQPALTARPAENVAEARAQIERLKGELDGAKVSGEMQFRHDELQQEIYGLEGKAKVVADLKTQADQIRGQMAGIPTPEKLGLSRDKFERMRNFEAEQKRHKDALEKLEAERAAVQAEEIAGPPPLSQDKRFLGAIAVGVALLVGGGFLEASGRYLSLLGIPAFTFAAILALRHIEELQHWGKRGATAEVFAQREKKLVDDFALLETTINAALVKVNANSVEDFFNILRQTDGLRPQLQALEGQISQAEADPAYQASQSTLATLKAEQTAIDEKLLGMSSGYVRDSREIEREIERLEESIRLAKSPSPKSSSGLTTVQAGPSETYEDPVPALMVLASDLFHGDVPTVWSTLQPRAVQYLTALTDRRYHGLDVDKDGNATVHAPGRSIAAGQMPGPDLDLLYLALRLTVVEKHGARGQIPVIFEDAFTAAVDPGKQQLLGRMLKHVGTLTQVLHVTPFGQNAASADAQVAL